jgi:hypothetical protein
MGRGLSGPRDITHRNLAVEFDKPLGSQYTLAGEQLTRLRSHFAILRRTERLR